MSQRRLPPRPTRVLVVHALGRQLVVGAALCACGRADPLPGAALLALVLGLTIAVTRRHGLLGHTRWARTLAEAGLVAFGAAHMANIARILLATGPGR